MSCILQEPACDMQVVLSDLLTILYPNTRCSASLQLDTGAGMRFAYHVSMNLTLWLPMLFLLGLATFALLFAFLAACERV